MFSRETTGQAFAEWTGKIRKKKFQMKPKCHRFVMWSKAIHSHVSFHQFCWFQILMFREEPIYSFFWFKERNWHINKFFFQNQGLFKSKNSWKRKKHLNNQILADRKSILYSLSFLVCCAFFRPQKYSKVIGLYPE